MKLPYFRLTRIGSFFYFRLPEDKAWRPTFQISKGKAEGYIVRLLKRQLTHQSSKLTVGEYADRFFVWNRCPYVKRLYAEGGTVSQKDVRAFRDVVESDLIGTEFAEKLLINVDKATLKKQLEQARHSGRDDGLYRKVLCIILHEAYLRVEIRHDPTDGIC